VRVLDNSTTKDSLKSAQIKPKSIIDKLEVGSDSNKSVDDPFQNELKQAASGIEVLNYIKIILYLKMRKKKFSLFFNLINFLYRSKLVNIITLIFRS
jgi:hypothetical protein